MSPHGTTFRVPVPLHIIYVRRVVPTARRVARSFAPHAGTGLVGCARVPGEERSEGDADRVVRAAIAPQHTRSVAMLLDPCILRPLPYTYLPSRSNRLRPGVTSWLRQHQSGSSCRVQTPRPPHSGCRQIFASVYVAPLSSSEQTTKASFSCAHGEQQFEHHFMKARAPPLALASRNGGPPPFQLENCAALPR